MRSILRKLFYMLCVALDWRVDRRARILMYHSFRIPGAYFNVEPEEFRKQVSYLKNRGYAIISLPELYERLQIGRDLRRTIVLTFDDGHADFIDAALPIIEGFPLTVFWPTKLLSLTTSEGIACPLLSHEQIKVLSEKESIEIGSHAATHRELTMLSSGECDAELTSSYDVIHDITKKPVAFAYPRGKYTAEIAQRAKDAGYYCACTVKPGSVNRRSDTFALPRLSIDSKTDMLAFKAKLSWLYAAIYTV